jgi:hypothetical protein
MTVRATFNGQVFVPEGPVDLPAGTKVDVLTQPARRIIGTVPTRELTPEEEAVWSELTENLRNNPPDPPTLEECMRQIRGRP